MPRPTKWNMFTGHPHCNRCLLHPIIRKSSSSAMFLLYEKISSNSSVFNYWQWVRMPNFNPSACSVMYGGYVWSKGLNSYPSGNHERSPPSILKGQKVTKETKGGTIFEFIKLAVRYSLHKNIKKRNID